VSYFSVWLKCDLIREITLFSASGSTIRMEVLLMLSLPSLILIINDYFASS
jgi:hypothetical protein